MPSALGSLDEGHRWVTRSREQEFEVGESADVDFVFDVPLLAAKELTGFKHDESLTCLAQPSPLVFFDVQAAPAKRTRPWWKPW